MAGWWYSMWQTPGTHASSTFHAAHSPDAGLPRCPCPPPGAALCARIISQQRRRRRWSHPSEGSPPPPSSSISLFLSPSACSCLSTLAAFILSLFSPRRGDTKRHLPGRDKPILEMPRGNLTLPASPSLHLSLLLFLPGRAVVRWASSTISASVVCVFLGLCVFFFFWVCVCVLRRFKGFCLYSSPVNLIHGGQRRQGGDSKGQFQGLSISVRTDATPQPAGRSQADDSWYSWRSV